MLDVINLEFDYAEIPLLKGVSFSLRPGQLLYVKGDNGKGKTTLLKLLAGLLYPTAGDIRYAGSSCCYVGHKTGVSALLTVREYWALELSHEHNSVSFEEAIARLALEGTEDRLCGVLSAGQRRRVGLLRLLISNAKLWLLDEPFSALDHQTVLNLKGVIESHLTSGGLAVLTSHQTLPFDASSYDVCVL
ncbi:MAG: heme ABC exporter ATP-binding protein CcmA [Legionellaceae bacterium]